MGNAPVMKIAAKLGEIQKVAAAAAAEPAPPTPEPSPSGGFATGDSFPITNPFGTGISLEGLVDAVTTLTKQGRGKDLSKDTVEEQEASFNERMKQFRMVKTMAMEQAKQTGDWPTEGFTRAMHNPEHGKNYVSHGYQSVRLRVASLTICASLALSASEPPDQPPWR